MQVNRNGLRTIAVGTGDTKRLKLPYLSTSADVVVGDLLVTSGLGGGFPAGYPVGTVSEVKRDPRSRCRRRRAPAAALDRRANSCWRGCAERSAARVAVGGDPPPHP